MHLNEISDEVRVAKVERRADTQQYKGHYVWEARVVQDSWCKPTAWRHRKWNQVFKSQKMPGVGFAVFSPSHALPCTEQDKVGHGFHKEFRNSCKLGGNLFRQGEADTAWYTQTHII